MFKDVYLKGAGLAVFIAILCAVVLVAVLFNVIPLFVKKWRIEYKTRDLTYGAVCLALSYALSWLGITLPKGGTITIASLVPIFIYCYYFGFRRGVAVVAAYTLLQFTQFPYIVTPLSAVLDYIIPYFSLCVAGIFSYKPEKYKKFVSKNQSGLKDGAKGAIKYWAYTVAGHWGIFLGAVLHMLIRYVSQTTSGIVFYELYYGESVSFGFKLGFSLGYNAYGLIDSAIAIAALVILLSSRTFDMFMSSAFAKSKKRVPDADVAAEQAAVEPEPISESDKALTDTPEQASPDMPETPSLEDKAE